MIAHSIPIVLDATADTAFLLTLAAAFVAALLGGMLAIRLKQSPIVGYLVAGLLIGPFTPGFTANTQIIERFANIGVVLLLFGVGVHFSFGDLIRFRIVAGIGGVLQVALTTALGLLVGVALGWSPLAGFFLGGAVAISSSAVLAKLLEERGQGESLAGSLALAWMVVQDLATVLLVVLLTGLSGGADNVAAGVAIATGKAVVFVVVLLVIGGKLLPLLLTRVLSVASRELFLVAISAIALGTAFLAEEVGISLALGAFLAGLVLSESDLAHHILEEIAPVRDLFAVLFFVSIGMLVDPRIIIQSLPIFALVFALVVIAKALISFGLLRVLRQSFPVAAVAGVSLAQAGEFSFLLAQIGHSAEVLTGQQFTVILGACAASIIVAPALLSAASRITR